jgi:plasmid stability protein
LTLDPFWNHNGTGFFNGGHMPNLSIKDVPEPLAEALRQRAAQNHRSLQGELMAIIQQAVQPGTPPAGQSNAPVRGTRRGTKTIEQIFEERRGRYPEPVRGFPLAVDIIRADRDSR